MKTIWEIEFNKQVLYEGTWDSDDCAWDWEISREKYNTYEGAFKAFNKLTPTSDIPLIRLYKCVYDKYGLDYEELIHQLESCEREQ